MEATDPIDDYLADRLSPAERAAFEQRLAADPALRAEVALQRRIDAAAAERRDDARYRELIRQAHQKYGTVEAAPVRRRLPKRWLALAAAVAVLAVALLWFQPWRDGPRQLAARYGAINRPVDYLPPAYRLSRTPTNAATAAPSDPVRYARTLVLRDTTPEIALQAYRQIPADRLDDSLRFETALLYLATEQPVPALDLLDRLGPDFRDDRLWYAALAHLQQGERTTARRRIDELLQLADFTPYRRDAQRLREEL